MLGAACLSLAFSFLFFGLRQLRVLFRMQAHMCIKENSRQQRLHSMSAWFVATGVTLLLFAAPAGISVIPGLYYTPIGFSICYIDAFLFLLASSFSQLMMYSTRVSAVSPEEAQELTSSLGHGSGSGSGNGTGGGATSRVAPMTQESSNPNESNPLHNAHAQATGSTSIRKESTRASSSRVVLQVRSNSVSPELTVNTLSPSVSPPLSPASPVRSITSTRTPPLALSRSTSPGVETE
jgi:hypothetical protein